MKNILRNASRLLGKIKQSDQSFSSSSEYWEKRYQTGGNSGAGSYNNLAEFKAEIINTFVQENEIQTIIEYGCGDGNQLRLAKYPSYIGYDVSESAISICSNMFTSDKRKKFKLIKDYAAERAQLTLSLDVIYHLTEDYVFNEYMARLFDSSDGFVVVYSSNTDEPQKDQAPHVKHRKFTSWIDSNRPLVELIKHIPNKYVYTGDITKSSTADFFIYKICNRLCD